MNRRHLHLSVLGALLFTVILGASGCSTGAPKQSEAAFVETMTVPLGFESAWELTRDVLLEEDVEIYTRDKRGLFVAYTKTRRKNLIVPWRTKLTISLQEQNAESTKIAVETVRQRYTVTPLTYPSWRDKDFVEGDSAGTAFLESIKSRIVQN